jgi:hypothetical protein
VVDKATAHQVHDQYLIRKKTWNNQPWANGPWKEGYSALMFTTFYGFANTFDGIMYIVENPGGAGGGGGEDQQLPTIVHEMLHLNAAGGFADAVKGAVDEGMTEKLTIKALQQAGKTIKAEYADERAFVDRLIALVGEGTLTSAYFGGASILIGAFEAIRGEGKWAALMNALSTGRDDRVKALLEGPGNTSILNQKIAQIQDLLSGWVTDDDVNQAITIIGTCSDDEKRTIYNTITGMIRDLSDHGQRARLRIALGG